MSYPKPPAQLRFFISLLLLTVWLPFFASPNWASDFPKLFNTEPVDETTLMTGEAAAKKMNLPDGFRASLFAGEPAVQNPIAMTWDSAGRLWIAENYTYAERQQRFQLDLRDRVVIFEGTEQDQFTKRTVFTDQIQMLTGIEVGLDGVWLMCPPQLLFIPDRDHDDIPDSNAEVVLDGFTVADQNYHNFANGLRFGPDGWLYGRCGGSCPGRIGLPGTPDHQRLALEGGMWRYHPIRKQVEVLTTGTTNPWGHDWNEVGEAFFVNTVNGHLWHSIPGAHFTRPFTLDPNRKTYELIDFHADHWHFDTGKSWTDSRDGAANEYGGGHAHIGAMIYQGDNWPPEYVGKLFTLNMHGKRANQERLTRDGSGYVAEHEPDFFRSEDDWFRGMDLSTGPDGSVFVIDWSDAGECHEHTGVHRTSGRIFKIRYEDDKKQLQIQSMRGWTQEELGHAHQHPNHWYTRQARLELLRRHAGGQDLGTALQAIRSIHQNAGTNDLRALVQTYLSLHILGGLRVPDHYANLQHPNEHVRAWAIRFLTEDWTLDDALGPKRISNSDQREPSFSNEPWETANAKTTMAKLIQMTPQDSSALVRLTLASTLQRLPVTSRVSLASELAKFSQDANDHNLPLMIWYGLIAVSEHHPESLVEFAAQCRLHKTLQLVSRSIAEQIDQQPENANELLKIALRDPTKQHSILAGFSDGLRGWQNATMPKCWPEIQKIETATLSPMISELSVLFGDGRAVEGLKHLASNRELPDVPLRIQALQTLIRNKSPEVKELCLSLLNDNRINFVAAQGLASFDDTQTADQLIKNYHRFRGPKRPQIISILASRPTFAMKLLQAVEDGKIPKDDLTVYQVRQIKGFADTGLSQQLSKAWGEIRNTTKAKQEQINELKSKFTAGPAGRPSHGRVLFQKLCRNCHRLYGDGETIGPDLTGSNRSNLDYLLQNIVAPSDVVDKDYRMQIVLLVDGRTLNGMIIDRTERVITLQTATERLYFDLKLVESIKSTELSPMPDGLLESLEAEEIKDLISYLQHPIQVELPSDRDDE